MRRNDGAVHTVRVVGGLRVPVCALCYVAEVSLDATVDHVDYQ